MNDYLELYGEANDVCIHKTENNIPYFSCNNYTSDPEDRAMVLEKEKPFERLSLLDFNDHCMKRNFFSKLGFFISCRTISPTNIHSLKMAFGLKYASSSWVDIQIRLDSSQKSEDTQPLPVMYGLSQFAEHFTLPYHLLKKLSNSETHALVLQFDSKNNLKLEPYSMQISLDVSICFTVEVLEFKSFDMYKDDLPLMIDMEFTVDCPVYWKSTLHYSNVLSRHIIFICWTNYKGEHYSSEYNCKSKFYSFVAKFI